MLLVVIPVACLIWGLLQHSFRPVVPSASVGRHRVFHRVRDQSDSTLGAASSSPAHLFYSVLHLRSTPHTYIFPRLQLFATTILSKSFHSKCLAHRHDKAKEYLSTIHT
ncbi:hypothetical protein EDC01DRAFT_463795 [Geopyxis carbonaria]|nr:hypothetical protein EDC01DRAFT_463795 [Geopyxis carbonaria]